MTTQQYQDLEVKNKLIAKIIDARELGDDLLAAIKRAVFDVECPVGSVEEQHLGEPTPAEKYGMGTWTIDTEMQGRVPLGSGGSYELGAKGGSNEHQHSAGGLGTAISFNTVSTLHLKTIVSVGSTWSSTYGITVGERTATDKRHTDAVAIEGNTGIAKNLPSYTVVTYWKRVA